MIYPVAIVLVAIVVVAVLMIFVIPVFAELYGSMGQALPAPTQICINISNFFVAYWWLMLLAAIGVVTAIKLYYKTPRAHEIDALLLRMPVIGDLLRKVAGGAVFSEYGLTVEFRRTDLGWLAITGKRPVIKLSKKPSWRVG